MQVWKISGLLGICLLLGVLPLTAAAIAAAPLTPLTASDRLALNQQITKLIKGLDSNYINRQQYVHRLAALAKGAAKQLLLQRLNRALGENQTNEQRLQGVIETLTVINDRASVPVLSNELRFAAGLNTRRATLTHLPLFCVTNPKKREELRGILADGNRVLTARQLSWLRALPLKPQSESYDRLFDEERRRPVETALVEQLAPVVATIRHGLEGGEQLRALNLLKYWLGVDLGYSRSRWLTFWRNPPRDFSPAQQAEITTIQILACKLLADMGVEGTLAFTDNVTKLIERGDSIASVAGAEVLAVATTLAVRRAPAHQRALARQSALSEGEIAWRQRQLAAQTRLVDTVFALAAKNLANHETTVRLALVDCLGATADRRALPLLNQALRQDSQTPQMVRRAAKALGQVGGKVAAQLLRGMAEYRGIDVTRPAQINEYRRVRAAYASLAQIIGQALAKPREAELREAGEIAVAALSEALADSRQVQGAPAARAVSERELRFFARAMLRQALGTVSPSYEAEFWQKLFAAQLAKAAAATTAPQPDSAATLISPP